MNIDPVYSHHPVQKPAAKPAHTAAGAAVPFAPAQKPGKTAESSAPRPPAGEQIFWIGHGDGQKVSVELLADSKPEDPVVRISGVSAGGSFDYIRHIHEINPAKASYADLCALTGYQNKLGTLDSSGAKGLLSPVPVGTPVGDVSRTRDYLDVIRQYISSGKCGPSICRQGEALLALYEKLLNRSEEDLCSRAAGELLAFRLGNRGM